MTPDQVQAIARETVRTEMRALRRVLWETGTQGNHDAQCALDKVREAIDKQFPQSPAEFVLLITDYNIDIWAKYGDYDVEQNGKRMGEPRHHGESISDYVTRLKLRRKFLTEQP